MKIEIIGGDKKWQDALLKKLAKEIDPKKVLNKTTQKPKNKQ
tara:strand:+ start:241 stop:366 length:126 start_codon:yes stop_codon:yes gene_type:complete